MAMFDSMLVWQISPGKWCSSRASLGVECLCVHSHLDCLLRVELSHHHLRLPDSCSVGCRLGIGMVEMLRGQFPYLVGLETAGVNKQLRSVLCLSGCAVYFLWGEICLLEFNKGSGMEDLLARCQGYGLRPSQKPLL